MSIPLDRLYHYIESVAQEVYGDTVIYRFYPHGSKKLEDLLPLNELNDPSLALIKPQIYCNDQEPLNYNHYQSLGLQPLFQDQTFMLGVSSTTADLPMPNLRYRYWDIYNDCILLHSEKNSHDLQKYQENNFITVYYWSHAIIARDWFRSAQHFTQNKSPKKTFLIYNRAWSGTREYRLKFAELLVNNNLVDNCMTTFNSVEIDTGVHYSNHQYQNSAFSVTTPIENYFDANKFKSCASADFVLNDYESTNIEIVLETLFDDQRLHLTEKIFRPIACGQPFMLASTPNSLAYLRSYGFKTFGDIIDESYDSIIDPYQRLEKLVSTMKDISLWTLAEKKHNLKKLQEISDYNRTYFFSDKFFNLVTSELKTNLSHGLTQLILNNNSKRYFDLRKRLYTDPALHHRLIGPIGSDIRQYNIQYVKTALKFKK
jgi:hypothetical protein